MTDDAEIGITIDVAPVAKASELEALESRRRSMIAIERILDAVEPLTDRECEAEALCHALLLIGARNAARAALEAMEQDL